MSKFFNYSNIPQDKRPLAEGLFGKARGNQPINEMQSHFDRQPLEYLSEKVLNHIADSLTLGLDLTHHKNKFNDFSFLTAPAYKAFEGFLFQIATDLKLPSSGNPKFVGTYFDEELVDKTINKLIKELEQKTDTEAKLTRDEKRHIKDMVAEMNRFLHNYRHTPAHFHGDPMTSIERASQNILSMYRIMNETIKTLLNAKLITISDELH